MYIWYLHIIYYIGKPLTLNAHTQICKSTHTHTSVHTHMHHTRTHKQTRTRRHIQPSTCVRVCVRVCVRACVHITTFQVALQIRRAHFHPLFTVLDRVHAVALLEDLHALHLVERRVMRLVDLVPPVHCVCVCVCLCEYT